MSNAKEQEAAVVNEKREGGRDRDGHTPKNRIFEHTAELKEEAQDMASSISELTRDVSETVSSQLRQRPYAVLGAAAAVGYVLGGGLASRITRTGMSVAMRIGMGMLVRQFVEGQAAFGGAMSGEGEGESLGEGGA